MPHVDPEVKSRRDALEASLDSDPDNASLWLQYATLLHNAKCDPAPETVYVLERAALLNPDVDFRLRIGDALVDAGQGSEGLRSMYSFLGDFPRLFGYQILARDLINLDKHRRALKVLRRALALDSHSAETYYLLGRLAEAKGEKLRAISYFRKAVTIEPSHQPGRRELGYRLVEHDTTRKQGIEELRIAVDLDPSDPWSLIGLGLGHWLADNVREAEPYYKRAASLFPDDVRVQKCWSEFRAQAIDEGSGDNTHS